VVAGFLHRVENVAIFNDVSSNYRIENNLCLKGGIKFREGFCAGYSTASCSTTRFIRTFGSVKVRDEVLRNICSTGYRPIGMPKVWGKEVDFNLFVDAKGLKQAQGLGRDLHSVAGDPQFINPAEGDFRVKEGSPALLKLGFKNFAHGPSSASSTRGLKALARTPKIDVRKF